MRLETLISAWYEAKAWVAVATGSGKHAAFMGRKCRQEELFWHVIQDRIDDYRSEYLETIARDLKNYCPQDNTGFWPYRGRHAHYINELVAAGYMELSQRDPPRWRFK